MAKGPVNQHKKMAMGQKPKAMPTPAAGYKKGGKVAMKGKKAC